MTLGQIEFFFSPAGNATVGGTIGCGGEGGGKKNGVLTGICPYSVK